MKILNRIANLIESRLDLDRWYSSYALANLAAGGVSVLIPLYVLNLGGGVGDIGLLTAIGNLVGVPASIAWGTLSDRWNIRKPFVVFGFFGIGLTFFLMGFIRSLPLLLLFNAAYILFWMASASVVMILIIEAEDRGKWDDKIGSFNVSSGLGWAIGLALGLAWTSLATITLSKELSIRYLFFVLGLFALGACYVAIKAIPGDIRFERSRVKGRLVEAGDMITERFRYLPIHLYYLVKPGKFLSTVEKFGPNLTAFIVAVGLFSIGFSTFFIPLPAYFKTVIGLSDGTIYLLFIANSLASAIFYRTAARFTKRSGPLRVLKSSLALRVVFLPTIVAPFLGLESSGLKLFLVSLIMVIIGISWALINVSNLVITSKLSPNAIKGQVFGAYNGVIGLSAVFGSLIGGYVAKSGGYLTAFLLASLFIALGLAIVRRKINRDLLEQID